MTERSCAICGCTETKACVDERGPCSWAGPNLCSHCAQPDANRELALVSASQASEAVAELLRLNREGRASDTYSFSPDIDVPRKLAEALLLAATIELGDLQKSPGDWSEDIEALSDLVNTTQTFIAGWIG